MNPAAGIGLKALHGEPALASPAADLWFEVHAENYMVAGGPRLALLEQVRAARPLSLHGVGLSLAGAQLPDLAHLAALKRLADRFEPFALSEHLAWSRHGGAALPDLLPVPRTNAALAAICRNIDFAQSLLGRQLLIENPSHYLTLAGHGWSEPEFLAEIVRRTGCGLLLDLANVHVSAVNLGFDPLDYLAAFPCAAVAEIHVAGSLRDTACDLLVDNHGAPVAAPVWALLERFIRHHGPRPVLVEWDREVPEFSVLMAERTKAARLIAASQRETADA